MLKGLSSLEIGRLRMSVGHGTNKKGRLLSPIEVGILIDKAKQHNTLEECETEIKLDESTINRFLNILKLPEKIRHMITWGKPRKAIGFSHAYEMVGIHDGADQDAVANAIITNGLKREEVVQIRQLLKRSGRDVSECIDEVIGMRTILDKCYVFVGSLSESNLQKKLKDVLQLRRDSILAASIEEIGLESVQGRLGTNYFTLVGEKNFFESMNKIGAETIESKLREIIADHLANE